MADLNIIERLSDEVASTGQFDRETKLPSTPPPTQANLLEVTKSLKAIIDAREGASGSVLDKSLTLRDLLSAGLLNVQVGGANLGSDPVDGVSFVGAGAAGPAGPAGPPGAPGGGWADPRPYLTTPPTLGSVTAVGTFRTVIIKWTMVDYLNHVHVEVWRAATSSLGAASLIGVSTSNIFVDESAAVGQTYYYWVRAVGITVASVLIYGAYDSIPGTSGGPGRIDGTDLNALIVEAGNLAAGAVTASKLAVNSIAVGTAAIQNGAIVNAMMGNAAIDTANIVDLAVQTGKIADLAVTDAKINSLNANKITTGTLDAGRIATDSITADKIDGRSLIIRDAAGTPMFGVGTPLTQTYADSTLRNDYVPTGINLIYNSAFEAGLSTGWVESGSSGGFVPNVGLNLGTNWQLLPLGGLWTSVLYMEQLGGAVAGEAHYYEWQSAAIAVAPNTRYVMSAHIQNHRCSSVVFARVYDAAGSLIQDGAAWAYQADNEQTNGKTLDKYARPQAAVLTASTAAYAIVFVRKYSTNPAAWTTASSYSFFTRLQFEQASSNSVASAWSDSSRQHIISSSNASTYIANAAIGTAQIGTLNASVITAGTITTDRLQLNATFNAPIRTSLASAVLYSGGAVSFTSTYAQDGASFSTVAGGRVLGSFTGVANVILNTTSDRWVSVGFKLQLIRVSDGAVMDQSGYLSPEIFAAKRTSSSDSRAVVPVSVTVPFDGVAAGTYKVRITCAASCNDSTGGGASNLTYLALTGEIGTIEFKV